MRDRSVFGLDYVEENEFRQLLADAWAVVIPTLAEGAGLPVLEAMLQGIPVVSSDIPAAREMIGATGGEVLWFDPTDAADLARTLEALRSDYDRYKRLAVSQVSSLRRRGWDEVAAEYLEVMRSVASAHPTASREVAR